MDFVQLSRKHLSDYFFNAEVEVELGEGGQKGATFFGSNSDREVLMTAVETKRASTSYAHTPSSSCAVKGNLECDYRWHNSLSPYQANYIMSLVLRYVLIACRLTTSMCMHIVIFAFVSLLVRLSQYAQLHYYHGHRIVGKVSNGTSLMVC